MRAVAYERSVFSPKQGNWPDFRGTSQPKDFMCTWCHGAPGILLSRLVIRSAGFEDDEINMEILAARSTSLNSLSHAADQAQGVAHLCCGFFGLSSLLRIDSLKSGIKLATEVLQAESTLIKRAQSLGEYTYSRVGSGSVNLPGLFTGKAGVALALLESETEMHWMPYILSAGLL